VVMAMVDEELWLLDLERGCELAGLPWYRQQLISGGDGAPFATLLRAMMADPWLAKVIVPMWDEYHKGKVLIGPDSSCACQCHCWH
jgi:hypothetical protein